MNILDLLFPDDYNSQIVLPAAAIYGSIAGAVGVPLILKKRALIGDAIGHASLPGVVLAFLIGTLFWDSGKSMPLLLSGGVIAGFFGTWVLVILRNKTTLKADARIAVVLSFFFGLGVVLLSIAQSVPGGDQAGLEGFIYGRVAMIRMVDAKILIVSSLIVWGAFLTFFKEIKLVMFDFVYGKASGYNSSRIDSFFLLLSVLVVTIGLPTVGLILGVSMLVIPAAAARSWCNTYNGSVIFSSCVGGLSAWVGSGLSSLSPSWPAGALIVLSASFLYLFGLFFGKRHGMCFRFFQKNKLQKNIDIQHLLRAMWEIKESGIEKITLKKLNSSRRWCSKELSRAINRALRKGFIKINNTNYDFTLKGFSEAKKVIRRHRLWECYLVEFASIDPSHVDRDADQIEHILGEEIVSRLEKKLGIDKKQDIKSLHPTGDTS